MSWYKPLLKNKQHKHGAKRAERAGHSFASGAEASLFDYLKLLERAGEIEYRGQQKRVTLIGGPREERIEYYADFLIFDKKIEREVYVEMKGFETDVWRLKRRLWFKFGPTLLRVYKKRGSTIYLFEEIEGGNNARLK